MDMDKATATQRRLSLSLKLSCALFSVLIFVFPLFALPAFAGLQTVLCRERANFAFSQKLASFSYFRAHIDW